MLSQWAEFPFIYWYYYSDANFVFFMAKGGLSFRQMKSSMGLKSFHIFLSTEVGSVEDMFLILYNTYIQYSICIHCGHFLTLYLGGTHYERKKCSLSKMLTPL